MGCGATAVLAFWVASAQNQPIVRNYCEDPSVMLQNGCGRQDSDAAKRRMMIAEKQVHILLDNPAGSMMHGRSSPGSTHSCEFFRSTPHHPPSRSSQQLIHLISWQYHDGAVHFMWYRLQGRRNSCYYEGLGIDSSLLFSSLQLPTRGKTVMKRRLFRVD